MKQLPVAASADSTMLEAMKIDSLADQDFSATFEAQKK